MGAGSIGVGVQVDARRPMEYVAGVLVRGLEVWPERSDESVIGGDVLLEQQMAVVANLVEGFAQPAFKVVRWRSAIV